MAKMTPLTIQLSVFYQADELDIGVVRERLGCFAAAEYRHEMTALGAGFRDDVAMAAAKWLGRIGALKDDN